MSTGFWLSNVGSQRAQQQISGEVVAIIHACSADHLSMQQ